MKKIKNVLLLLLALVIFCGVTGVNAEEKVKVYVFEAGGCPYCEAELEYLKGLSSYNDKFEIIQKELYIDHVDWKWGKDYPVGKAVAEAFLSAGFEDASYQGTPFVVISDLYAAAAYSTNLEEIINQAYEAGDKDVVGCYANDGTNCLEGADPSIKVDWSLVPSESEKDDKKDVETISTIILLLFIAGSIALVIYTGKRNAESVKVVSEKVEVEEEKTTKREVKKASTSKKVTKKTTNKKK